MKPADVVLVASVVLLAAFVGAQATVHHDVAGQALSFSGRVGLDGPRAVDERAGVASADAADDRNATAATASGTLLTGTLGERRALFVPDVARPVALPARELQRRLQLGAAGTYIDQLLVARDSILTRWPDRLTAPLRVWIGDGGLLDGWDPTHPASVREAFGAWAATGIPLRFTFVRDSGDADVRVRFVPSFTEGISGRTIWSRDTASWLVAGDIDLSLRHPRGEPVTREQLHAIALHEIGHLLGLDHVDDPAHIMAPRVRARALSEGDVATVRLLYSVPAGSARP